jgi:predicted transcriptional regulator
MIKRHKNVSLTKTLKQKGERQMALTKQDRIILEHEDPAALFAAEVEGEEIGVPDEMMTKAVTCRVDRSMLAHLDIFAKRRNVSRARILSELIEIGFHGVMKALAKETREEIESEAIDILRAEYLAEKEGK